MRVRGDLVSKCESRDIQRRPPEHPPQYTKQALDPLSHLVRHRTALLEEEPPGVVRRRDALGRQGLEDAAGDEPCR